MGQCGEIISLSNSQVKYIKSLQNKPSLRKKEGLFVVEGIKIFLEAPLSLIKTVYIADSVLKELSQEKGFTKQIREQAIEKLKNIPYIKISDEVSKSISDTVTPQGVFVVVKCVNYDLKDIIKKKQQIFVVLDEIKDPGNMGTIIRTAEGAGVAAVIMNNRCVDIFNPKVTRSTMGSIFRVPFIIEENLTNSIELLRKNGVVTYAAHLNGGEYYGEENLKGSVAIFVGNEAKGLSDEVTKMADKLIKIPMEGELESLNAGVAAGILMYEARRKNIKTS